jgi:hypothetical protein
MTKQGSSVQCIKSVLGDPLGWLLFCRLRLNAIRILVLLWFYAAVELLLLPWIENYSSDPGLYLWQIVLLPTIWVYYAVSRNRGLKLLQDIEDNSIIEETSADDFSRFAEHARQSLDHPVLAPLAFFGGGLTAALVYFAVWERQPPPWSFSLWHMRLSFLVLIANGYAGWMAVLRELVTAYWLSRTCRQFPIYVHPLHQDRAGGLGFIGIHYQRLTPFVAAIGMWFTLSDILKPITEGQPIAFGKEVIVGLIVYSVVAPLSFFVPIWSAHTAMKRKKLKIIQEVSAQFDLDFESMRFSLNEDAEVVGQRIQKIKSLQEMHGLVHGAYPTWPFSLQTLRRFSASAALPIVTSLASLVIDLVRS